MLQSCLCPILSDKTAKIPADHREASINQKLKPRFPLQTNSMLLGQAVLWNNVIYMSSIGKKNIYNQAAISQLTWNMDIL